MTIKKSLLLLAAVLSFCWQSSAQVKRVISLEEAIDLAIATNSQLKVDSVNYQIASSKLVQTKQTNLPQVNLNFSYLRLSDNITPFKVGFPTGDVVLNPQILNQSYNAFQVRQLVFSGGKIKQGEKLQVLEKDISVLAIKKTKNEAVASVTSIWFTLFNAQQNSNVIQSAITQLKNQQADVKNFIKEGISMDNDLLKIDLAITNLQASLSEIEALQRTLQYSLGTLIGLGNWEELEVNAKVPKSQIPLESLTVVLESAYKNRPELAMLGARKAQTEAASKIVNGNIWPTISAGGSYNYDLPNQRLFPNQAVFTGTWNVGVFLNWSLTDLYTNREKKSESSLQQQKILFAEEAVRKGISMEVSEKFNQWIQRKKQLASYLTAVQQATENFRVEKNRYQENMITTTDFLNANTQLLQSKMNLVTGEANAELAYHQLLNTIYSKN